MLLSDSKKHLSRVWFRSTYQKGLTYDGDRIPQTNIHPVIMHAQWGMQAFF